jgi:TolB-like protein/cytochrome c-type biogenesis protein CcmH/NrfG
MDWLSSIRTWLSDNEAAISAVAAMIVIAGVVFAGFRWLISRRSERASEAKPEEDPLLALPTGPVVAVLPFENLSRDPDQEYFSDGLTDDIITALSRFKDLLVIARNSTFRYKGQAVDVRQLNKELGARYVLEGSVQRAEERLRVTTQLLDAKDGTHLWAETYDRELSASNIFDVQDEITGQVAATIASSSGVIFRARFAEIREKPTDKLDAYESVLKTFAYETGGPTAPEHAILRDALERAVRSDPSYSDAWAWLSALYLDEDRYNYNPRPNPLDRALDAAQRAVALDPTSQVAYHVLAVVRFHRQEFDAFFADAERALALNPNHAFTLASLGARFEMVGDERGIALVKKAVKLDPFLPTAYNITIAAHHFNRGEYEEALAATRRMSVSAFPLFTQIFLAAIYAELGRQDDAQVALEELLRLRPDYTIEEQTEWMRKNNISEERMVRMTAALRKAGLPE